MLKHFRTKLVKNSHHYPNPPAEAEIPQKWLTIQGNWEAFVVTLLNFSMSNLEVYLELESFPDLGSASLNGGSKRERRVRL